MEKIIAIYCVHKYKPATAEYPDYKDKSYDGCVFTQLKVLDGDQLTTYSTDTLKDISYIFNKNVVLIAFDAYFHFNLLFHQLHKQGLDFDLGDC
jgi:hypothetical protein